MKERSGRRLAPGLAWLALACACSGITTEYDYNPSVDFTNLKTFAWMPVRARGLNQFEIERVTQAVEAGLTSRGYQRSENADFMLQVFAGVGQNLVASSGWIREVGRVYEEGALIIDIVDPASGQVLWRGSAVKTLGERQTPEEQSRTIAAAVDAILANFPPPGRR